MQIELQTTIKVDVNYLEVAAGVRYWEDSKVNGVVDAIGMLIPLRSGKKWAPVIDLSTGVILNWPEGTTASIHYKVCDEGEYWLQDAEHKRVAKYKSDYVPDILSCGENGYGDYIILKVDGTGKIEGWRGGIDDDEWEVA